MRSRTASGIIKVAVALLAALVVVQISRFISGLNHLGKLEAPLNRVEGEARSSYNARFYIGNKEQYGGTVACGNITIECAREVYETAHYPLVWIEPDSEVVRNLNAESVGIVVRTVTESYDTRLVPPVYQLLIREGKTRFKVQSLGTADYAKMQSKRGNAVGMLWRGEIAGNVVTAMAQYAPSQSEGIIEYGLIYVEWVRDGIAYQIVIQRNYYWYLNTPPSEDELQAYVNMVSSANYVP